MEGACAYGGVAGPLPSNSEVVRASPRWRLRLMADLASGMGGVDKDGRGRVCEGLGSCVDGFVTQTRLVLWGEYAITHYIESLRSYHQVAKSAKRVSCEPIQ